MDDADAEQLLASSRFGDLPGPLARELIQRGRARRCEKGEFVHRRGDPGDGLFRLLTGRLRVSTTGAEGNELVLTDLEPGSFFGEVSVFDGLPRTHDAYALERSELLFVPQGEVDALLTRYPALARHFLRALALKVRISLAALDGIALGSVSSRLAQRVFLLARGGQPSEAPKAIRVSQSDLAMMVGATRQSVNRELKTWEREGIVRFEGRRLVILDESALLERAAV